MGIPYFLPRKWVKATPEMATKAALEEIKRKENFNKSNANSKFKHEIKPFDEIYNEIILKQKFPVPLKIGFSMCGLGWKTKWDQYDIRHEWNPVISFVFFGYQIAATFYHPHQSHYWESWVCYEYCSDKKQSKEDRIAFCRKKCPQTWTRFWQDNNPVTTDYWDLIVKPKDLKP